MEQLFVAGIHGLVVLAVQAAFLQGLVTLLQKIGSLALQRVEGHVVLVDLGVGEESLVANRMSWAAQGNCVGRQVVRSWAGEPTLRPKVIRGSRRRLRASREVLVVHSRLLLQMNDGGASW